MNVNFREKTFVIAPIFRDSRCDTPTILKIQNFRERKSNHENIVPRKFGAIRYNNYKRVREYAHLIHVHVH